jgi:O-antigen/teichoic acid export membrane protein
MITLDAINRLKNKFVPYGSFRRDAMTLASGTAIAQVIPIVFSPILTRLYIPRDFGKFALYMAAVSVMSIVVTCRYEVSIMLPKRIDEKINNLGLSVALSIIISTLALLLWFVYSQILAIYKQKPPDWLFLVPLVSLFVGVYQSLNYWLISTRCFKRLSLNKVIFYSFMIAFQIGMGLLNVGYLGLIYGHIMGQALVTGLLVCYVLRENRAELRLIRLGIMIRQAKRYFDFMKFSLPADLINVLSNQIPYVLLNRFFGTRTVGLYSLPQRVLGAPVSLVSSSILDVFKERANREFQEKGNCRAIYSKTFKYLLLFSFILFGSLAIVSPKLIPFIFGNQWGIAGEYAQILCLLFFFRFIASPLSYVVFVVEKQKYDLIWQICLLVFTLLSIMFGFYFNSAKLSIFCFSVSYSIMYIVYLFLTYNLAKGSANMRESW